METVVADSMNLQARGELLQVGAVVHSTKRRLWDRVEHFPEGYRVRRSARWFTAIFAPIAPFYAISLLREIRFLNPDQITIHMPNLSAFWLLALPSARSRKWVILWHSDVIASKHSIGLRIFYPLYRWLENRLLAAADRIIVTSPPYLETSIPLQRVIDKVQCTPLAIDLARIPDKFRQKPQKKRLAGEGLRLLCVGRLTYYKDFATAISAIALLPTASLQIVGDGELREQLKTMIENYGVADRVTLMGRVDDETLWRCFHECDLLCLPSIERTEAFGLVILEAASFGKPSIVSDVEGSGMSWAIQQVQPRGYTFPAGDAKALAAQLASIDAELAQIEEFNATPPSTPPIPNE